MPNKQTDSEQFAKHLQPIYQHLCHQYTKGIRIPETLPAAMRRDFYGEMEVYEHTMSAAVSQCVVKAFENPENLSGGLQEISGQMQQQTRRLSNTFYQMQRRGQAYETLSNNPEYPFFLFLSEQGEHACDTCLTHHGELFNVSQLFASLWLIPPVHPNCKCRLVAMDTLMATRYNQNKRAFLAALETAARQYAPIYRLEHSAASRGINPGTLQPLPLRQMPVVAETKPEGPTWQERLVYWSNGFLSSALEALGRWSADFLSDAAAMVDAVLARGQERMNQAADADGLLAILLYADFLLGGLPSAVERALLSVGSGCWRT